MVVIDVQRNMMKIAVKIVLFNHSTKLLPIPQSIAESHFWKTIQSPSDANISSPASALLRNLATLFLIIPHFYNPVSEGSTPKA
jgi:hypothetical protein